MDAGLLLFFMGSVWFIFGFLYFARPQLLRDWLKNLLENGNNLVKEYESYASKEGFRVNPDKEAVNRLVKGLLANEQKHVSRYCPCSSVTGNKE